MTDPKRQKRTDSGIRIFVPCMTGISYFLLQRPCLGQMWAAGQLELAASKCKATMADNLIKWIEPKRARRREYEEQPDRVAELLLRGTTRARKTVRYTMKGVREAVFGAKERNRARLSWSDRWPPKAGD